MELILYTSNSTGVASNCLYPNRVVITDSAGLVEAGKFDQVFAKYKDNYRSIENFLESYVIPQDVDNESDDPNDWKTVEDLKEEFADVDHVIIPSRHNMLPKGNKSARPRHHILFPCQKYDDPAMYTAVKNALQKKYPFFDQKAQDAVRFFYGSEFESSDVVWHEGFLQIDETLDKSDLFETEVEKAEQKLPMGGPILEGSRNNTMSRFAGRVLKKYGVYDKAYQVFLQRSEQCDPPLDDSELNTIWNSAVKFAKKVQSQEGYVPPEEYNADFEEGMKPEHFREHDLGQISEFHETLEG